MNLKFRGGGHGVTGITNSSPKGIEELTENTSVRNEFKTGLGNLWHTNPK
jgi:hypothetical protein